MLDFRKKYDKTLLIICFFKLLIITASVTISAAEEIYVTNGNSNTVSIIQTSNNMVIATVTVGSGSSGVAITPDGQHAYVANNTGITVSVIETSSNTVVATVVVGNGSMGVAITPDGQYAYVAIGNNNTVSVIETSTNTVVAAVTVGSGPFGVAVSSGVVAQAFKRFPLRNSRTPF